MLLGFTVFFGQLGSVRDENQLGAVVTIRVPMTSEIRSLPLNSEDLQNSSEFPPKMGKIGKFLRFLKTFYNIEEILDNFFRIP